MAKIFQGNITEYPGISVIFLTVFRRIELGISDFSPSGVSGLYGYTALKKASLIRFLDRRGRVIKKCVERRMFPDAMKSWVELFIYNKSVAEHYALVIMSTLSSMSCFKEKKKSVAPRRTRRGRRRRIEILTDDESSDEDIGDDWRHRRSDHESDNDSVDMSWYVSDNDSDRESDNDSDEIDDRWRERMEYF